MMRRTEARSGRRALTAIELLVVIATIGVLIALFLPAVQATRMAALRAQCSNNLKNIGLALHQHATVHDNFPAGFGSLPGRESCFVRILPYLEQSSLFNSLNLEHNSLSNPNFTVFEQTPGILLCPSDSWRTSENENAINYSGNAGSNSIRGEGVFIGRPLTARDIPDGLSQTIGVAEWIVGPGFFVPGTTRPWDRRRNIHNLRLAFTESPSDVEAFVQACESVEFSDVDQLSGGASKGYFWLTGGMGFSQYNHALSPNQPSCTAKESQRAITAGSFHRGGVQALAMDGAVHFVKDSIDPRVWSALGSRADGEVVEDGAF